MKIIQLKTQNVKNIKVVEITPEGNAVVLTGRNGVGKSAVLDSILMALTGKSVEEPIRKGQERAEIEVDLGEIMVKRIITQKGTRLEVWNKEGAKFTSPQMLLNKIVGDLTFDPMAFSNMKPKPQRELLLQVIGVSVDDINERIKKIYDERTGVNRDIRNLEGSLSGHAVPAPELPAEQISINTEMRKIKELEAQREVYLKSVRAREDKLEQIQWNDERIKEMKKTIQQLEKDIDEVSEENKSLTEEIKKEPIEEVTTNDIVKANDQFMGIEEKNKLITAAIEYRGIMGNLDKAKEQQDKLSKEISKAEAEKVEIVKSAKYPIKGISVGDECVLFEDIPFSQLSTGQQIRISTAMAMAINPKLRVIMLREGSLLDSAGLKEIESIAGAKGYQVWIEKVDESGKIGVVIEDGRIVGAQSGKGDNNGTKGAQSANQKDIGWE